MIHGLTMLEGPEDWQIMQQENGVAAVRLAGTWQMHPDAVKVGVAQAHPVARVLREEDGYPVLAWQRAACTPATPEHDGTWEITLQIPAGGPYRIETGLDTISVQPGLAWMFRGDVRFHVGVGDVFIIAGQSNAAGYGRDNAYDAPDLRVHLLRNRGIWDLAAHPFNEATGVDEQTDSERGVCGSSPYLSFGKRFADFSHRPVGLVATALGGQPIRRWDPVCDGDLLQQTVQKIRLAGGKCAGILWYQGCSDTGAEDAPVYGSRFASMVQALRKELGCAVPLFTFQLNRELTPGSDVGYGLVREAQRKAANEIPGVYVLPTIDCDLADGIHNSGHANLRLGERLARQCAGVLCGAPALAAPEIAQATATGTTLALRFAHLVGDLALRTGDVRVCGVTVTDADGEIAITEVHTDRACPDTLFATLERAPRQDGCVSYLWQGNPLATPALDNATFLPPLSFYKYPVSCV